MKILIIDRDRQTAQVLQKKLEEGGHAVTVESVRKTAFDLMSTDEFDIIAIDPAPLSSARPIVLPLRWEQKSSYPYLIQLGHETVQDDLVRCGLNDVIAKPFDWQDVEAKLGNAERLTGFMRYLHEIDDIPASDLTFTKKSFYKLMLAALDRAHRYGEQAYLLMIRITNLEAIVERLGAVEAQALISSTTEYLARLHRMSDFLGHTAKAEHALLLLRPAADTEPQDAADRFAIALKEYQAQAADSMCFSYAMELWALPSGEILAQSSLPA